MLNSSKFLKLSIFFSILCAHSLAVAKEEKSERPALFDDLVNCRHIENAEKRLACYDSKVSAIDEAQQKEEIFIADKKSVEKTKKGLFGLSVPKLRIFGKSATSDIKEVQGVIQRASSVRGNQWTIILEDGAKWTQIQKKKLPRKPKSGMNVRIKKAALGSFMVYIDTMRPIKMRRVN